jgi:hypothetical protein
MGILNGVIGIFKMLYEEGEKEWLDESKYRESLNELYVKVESGEITDEEYEEAERAILDHLRVVQEYKKEHDYTG